MTNEELMEYLGYEYESEESRFHVEVKCGFRVVSELVHDANTSAFRHMVLDKLRSMQQKMNEAITEKILYIKNLE